MWWRNGDDEIDDHLQARQKVNSREMHDLNNNSRNNKLSRNMDYRGAQWRVKFRKYILLVAVQRKQIYAIVDN